jgi:hypothetical protein
MIMAYEISSRICGQSGSEAISGQWFGFWIADDSPSDLPGSGVVSEIAIYRQLWQRHEIASGDCARRKHLRQFIDMNRPKGLALTAILMAFCNAMIWATINPRRPPYSLRIFLFYTVVICIGYLFIWFYWHGRNWARIAVLLFSVLCIFNLGMWNSVSLSPLVLTTPAHIVMVSRAVLSVALLYWLNTYPVLEFFDRGKKQRPPKGFGP